MKSRIDYLELGIVLEKRASDHPWLDHEWNFVAVIPGAPRTEKFRILREEAGTIQYHAATLELELHHTEAEAYHYNLTSLQPSLFVVLRDDEDGDGDNPLDVALVTANPYEAQDYMDSSEELVERILIPGEIRKWLQEFVDAHYAAQEFKKRKRDRLRPEEYKFGQEPLAELRKRMADTQLKGDGSDVKDK